MNTGLAFVFAACILCVDPVYGQAPVKPEPVLKVEKLIDFGRDQFNLFDYCAATKEFFLCFRDENRALYRWDEKRRELRLVHKVFDNERCDDLEISPDGKRLILTTYGLGSKGNDLFRILFINGETYRVERIATLKYPVRTIRFSEDQKLVAIQPTWPNTTYYYDAKAEGVVGDDAGKSFPVDYSPLVWLVPGEKSNRPQGLFLRDSKGRTIHLHKYPLEFVVSKDKSITACTTQDAELCIWRTADGAELLNQQIGQYPVRVRYDSTANRLLIAGGKTDQLSTVSVVELERMKQR